MTMYGAVEQDERAATPRRAWGLVLAAGLIAAFGYLAPEATTSIKPAFFPVMPGIADGAALTTYAPTAAPANSTNSTNSTNVTTAEPTPSPMGCDEGSLDICVLTSSCPGIDSGEVKFPPDLAGIAVPAAGSDCGSWTDAVSEACCVAYKGYHVGCNDGCMGLFVDFVMCELTTLAEAGGSTCMFECPASFAC